MKKFFEKHQVLGIILSVFASIFLVTLVSYSATTISTNISSAGTLTVESASTTNDFWLGNVIGDDDDSLYFDASSSEYLRWDDDPGHFVFSDDLFISGNASTTGSATTSKSLYIGGTASTTELFVQDNVHIGGYATTSKLTIGTSTTHISNLLFGDCTVDLSSVGANSTSTATCTATGVMPGDKIFVTPGEGLMRYLTFGGASSSANNTIQVQVGNSSSTAVTDSTHTWYWMAVR